VKILSLEVRNIRGIKYIKIEPEGQNVAIFGPNGTGKSAIVDAIDFLFTGEISRLTGEGTKGFSLKEHGCHVDSRKDLKNTVVNARVEFGGKELTLERSISQSSSLKIKPKGNESLVKPSLEIAALGLHVLSRREILRYITSEAGKRAKEIMSLLNLTNIENLRATLVTVKNEAQDDLKHADSNFAIAKSELTKLLSLDEFSESASLNKVNELRGILHGSRIAQLFPERIKKGLSAYPFGSVEVALTRDQIVNTVKEIRALAKEKETIIKQDSELKALLDEVHREAKLQQYSLYEKLFEAGIRLVDASNVCPLCGRKWEVGNFKAHLEERLKEAEVAKEKQEKIDQISSFIKVKIDLLKNNVIICLKAHKQFNLDSIGEKEQKEYFSALDEWSEVMTRPQDSFESGKWPTPNLQDILGESLLERKMLAPLDKALEKLGEKLSIQQSAWDTLTKMEDQWKRYQQALQERQVGEIFKNRAEATLDHFEKARDSILENMYDTVKKSFEEYYKTLHSDDEGGFTSKISHVGPELTFEVNFYQRGMFPPHALHSEGHQDSMGLCLFLALNNYLAKDLLNVMVLDDVIMSIDRTHRRAICQLLKKFFTDRQYIITTHDNAWAKQLRTEGIVAQKNMIHFANWNIDTGPIYELEEDLWDAIGKDLDNDNIPAAAHKLRRNAECFFENVCDFLGAKVFYKGHHQWELGDFAPAAISAYKNHLKKAKLNFQKMGLKDKYEELKELEKKASDIIVKSQIEQWIVDANVHYNKWDEFGRNDFEPVVKAFTSLFGLFTCSICGSMIQRSQVRGGTSPKDTVSCACGKIFWNVQ
jgi:recombinational DNA repair ATPase RecF